ncbi:hypothetical protein A0H81_07609 [Grifola frondosa]|uniref:Uncharacterized protein n=1 Tax=Grifola frondosa TaxID=5627 RepID=A0A1C7M6D8_GRIFR|nr:hypothetical protein A0H81_07609 [Grifola frondosa]
MYLPLATFLPLVVLAGTFVVNAAPLHDTVAYSEPAVPAPIINSNSEREMQREHALPSIHPWAIFHGKPLHI